MIKKTYEQPTMQVIETNMEKQILAGSLSVQATGLDSEEELKYGDNDTKSGDVWNDAW